MTTEHSNDNGRSLLTPEQRARIEENRRKAEEKLRKKVVAANSPIRAPSSGGGNRRSGHTPNTGGTPAKQTTLFSFFKTPQSAKTTNSNADASMNTNDNGTEDRVSTEESMLLSSPLARFNIGKTSNGTHDSLSSMSSPPSARRVLFKTEQSSTSISNGAIKEMTAQANSSIERDVIPSSLTHFQSLNDDDDDDDDNDDNKMDTSVITTSNNVNTASIEPASNLRNKKRVRYIASDEDEDDNANGAKTTTRNGNSRRSTKSRLMSISDDDDSSDGDYKEEPDYEPPLEDMELDDDHDQQQTPVASRKSTKKIAVTPLKAKSPSISSSPSISDRLKGYSSSLDSKRGDEFGSSPPSSLSSQSQPALDKDRSRHPDRYPWLVNVRDVDGNAQGDPDYNPRTLFIPESAWKKFTPFEKQFWKIKQQFYDTVVFFKKGKFYELYENDADIGHSQFDLKMTDRVNMRMVGVPESSFEFWVGKFIAKGYKVAKVDQLETALGKALREKANKTPKEEKIIQRELTSVLTGGTLVDAGLLTNDMATFCLSIKEQIRDHNRDGPCIAVAFVDTSCAEFSLCYFEDELDRSKLETLLAQIQPKEIIYEKGHLSKETMRLLKNTLHGTIWNALVSGREYWDADQTVFEINGGDYFKDTADKSWPTALKKAQDQPLLMSAFGGLLWYLRMIRLDKELVSLKNFHTYDPLRQSTSLMIDGQTLKNLEIFENTFDGGPEGTLFQLLNKCITPFGKRMFKRWMCHPLRSIKAIEARLDTIDELNQDQSLSESIQLTMSRLPDLERMVSRVHAGTCKLKDLFTLLDAFARLEQLMMTLKETASESMAMPRLAALCDQFPSLAPPLDYFKTAFDRKIAEQHGSVIPYPGVEQDYDNIEAQMKLNEQRLQDYLKEQQTELKCKNIIYKDIGKERYQLEVPKNIKVPGNFMRLSQTKAVNRYWSPTLRQLVRDYEETMEIRSSILKDIQKRVYKKFDEYYELWMKAVGVAAELDSLLGMALCATILGEPCCRPEFIVNDSTSTTTTTTNTALLSVQELRHPCVIPGIATDFIPNDIHLGNNEPNMILLTGPNMGGKSTLLRQTCIAIIMAQMGCYVPARQCRLTPVDRIFTRIGANDNIMAGQSTFMVELSETAKILNEATSQSLVILDELGRGTSTFDGYAIAYSVLHYLATIVGCRGLFSTHYGLLTEEMAHHTNIALKHMSCFVDDDQKKVTFLYKLTPGACPKSYGMHVANMAGVPANIVNRAEEVAKLFEHQSRGHQLKMQDGQIVTVADHADLVYLTELLQRNCTINGTSNHSTDYDDPDRMLTSSPVRHSHHHHEEEENNDDTMMLDDSTTTSSWSHDDLMVIKRIWRTWRAKHHTTLCAL